MACCAFALFVIGQVVAFLAMVRRTLGLGAARDSGPPHNPATAWQLHGAVSLPRRSRRRLGPALLLIAMLEVGLVAAGAAWLRSGEPSPGAAPGAQWLDTAWCRSPASLWR
jgi:hypothetical protein